MSRSRRNKGGGGAGGGSVGGSGVGRNGDSSGESTPSQSQHNFQPHNQSPSLPAGQPTTSDPQAITELRATKFRVRWADRNDVQRILDIEHESFSEPWFEADLRAVLRRKHVWCKVATTFDGKKDNLVGYLIYQLCENSHDDKKRHFLILNLAVDPRYRRLGCGKRLIGELAARVLGGDSDDKRKTPYAAIRADVSEINLVGHQFFRKLGFVATGIDWRHREDGSAYTVYPFLLRREWLLAELDEFADRREAAGVDTRVQAVGVAGAVGLASGKDGGGGGAGGSGGVVSVQERPAEAVADVVPEDVHVAGTWTAADDDAVAEAGELADEVFGGGWAGDAGEFSGEDDDGGGDDDGGEFGSGGGDFGSDFGDDFDAGKFGTDA